jgi:hypothetical protein
MARLSRRKREVGLYIYGCFETPLVRSLCGLALGAFAAPVIAAVAGSISDPQVAIGAVFLLVPPICIIPMLCGAYYGIIGGFIAGAVAGAAITGIALASCWIDLRWIRVLEWVAPRRALVGGL